MKILGISGSPRSGQTTDKLVKAVLEGCSCETEFISLAGKQIAPCVACLGCVNDNVCTMKDDMAKLRDKIVEADGYVIGAPNYYARMNALTHAFLERFYQFRHQEGVGVIGKPAVVVGVGSAMPEAAADALKEMLQYHRVEVIGSVVANGPACCFTCGHGETCRAGAIHMFYGPGTKITPEITPSLEKQPEAIEEAKALGAKLYERLKAFAAGT